MVRVPPEQDRTNKQGCGPLSRAAQHTACRQVRSQRLSALARRK